MQPRWKMYKQLFRQMFTICLHTLQPIYNLQISAFYVFHHSVFHISIQFSTKLVIPHMLSLFLPLTPNQMLDHCSNTLLCYPESVRKDQRVQRRFTPTNHKRTDISSKGHTPNLGKQKFHREKIVLLSIETLEVPALEVVQWSLQQ